MTDDRGAAPLGRASKDAAESEGSCTTCRPVTIVNSEPCDSLEQALAREQQLKHWTRARKEALISGALCALETLIKVAVERTAPLLSALTSLTSLPFQSAVGRHVHSHPLTSQSTTPRDRPLQQGSVSLPHLPSVAIRDRGGRRD